MWWEWWVMLGIWCDTEGNYHRESAVRAANVTNAATLRRGNCGTCRVCTSFGPNTSAQFMVQYPPHRQMSIRLPHEVSSPVILSASLCVRPKRTSQIFLMLIDGGGEAVLSAFASVKRGEMITRITNTPSSPATYTALHLDRKNTATYKNAALRRHLFD